MTEPILKVTEPQTGVEVDLTGLSPEERALALMIVYRPEKYDGTSPFKCIVGGPAEIIDPKRHRGHYDVRAGYFSAVEAYDILAEAVGDETITTTLSIIYENATLKSYARDWREGIGMAAYHLDVDLDELASQLGLAPILSDESLQPHVEEEGEDDDD